MTDRFCFNVPSLNTWTYLQTHQLWVPNSQERNYCFNNANKKTRFQLFKNHFNFIKTIKNLDHFGLGWKCPGWEQFYFCWAWGFWTLGSRLMESVLNPSYRLCVLVIDLSGFPGWNISLSIKTLSTIPLLPYPSIQWYLRLIPPSKHSHTHHPSPACRGHKSSESLLQPPCLWCRAEIIAGFPPIAANLPGLIKTEVQTVFIHQTSDEFIDYVQVLNWRRIELFTKHIKCLN